MNTHRSPLMCSAVRTLGLHIGGLFCFDRWPNACPIQKPDTWAIGCKSSKHTPDLPDRTSATHDCLGHCSARPKLQVGNQVASITTTTRSLGFNRVTSSAFCVTLTHPMHLYPCTDVTKRCSAKQISGNHSTEQSTNQRLLTSSPC